MNLKPDESRNRVRHDMAVRRNAMDRERAAVLPDHRRLATLIGDVAHALAGEYSLSEMLQRCAESMTRQLDVELARVWTLSENRERFVFELQASAEGNTQLDGPHSPISVGTSLIARTAQNRLPSLSTDLGNDAPMGDREWVKKNGLVSFLGYPLIMEERTVGGVALFARHVLSREVVQAMGVVANQMALGIERKHLERAHRESQRRIRAVFDHGIEYLGLLSPDGAILDVNQLVLDCCELTRSQITGIPAWKTPQLDNSPDAREQIRSAIGAAAAGTCVHERMIVRGDMRSARTFDFSVDPVANEAGGVELLIARGHDITDDQGLQEQFRLTQKVGLLGRLAAGICHDFNNLLTVILGNSGIVLRQLRPTDPLWVNLYEIDAAALRASELTRQLLAFGRKQTSARVILDLNDVVFKMEKMLGLLVAGDVDLKLSLASGPWLIRADRGQIEQVIMNLAVNARDAMPRGGMLTIETANITLNDGDHADLQAGGYVLLTVTDTGCGMDKETASLMFEPFFTTKDPNRGTGLGLCMVSEIIAEHGGRLSVHSKVGRGTCLRIYLPRVSETMSLSYKS